MRERDELEGMLHAAGDGGGRTDGKRTGKIRGRYDRGPNLDDGGRRRGGSAAGRADARRRAGGHTDLGRAGSAHRAQAPAIGARLAQQGADRRLTERQARLRVPSGAA